MRLASDYALEHLAAHLHAAGQADRLQRLLVGNRAWMDARFERAASHAPYVGDLQVARVGYADPLDAEPLCRLLELHAARLVTNARIVLDTDIDLEVLAHIGRAREALEAARLRSDPHVRFEGIVRIEALLRERGRPEPALLDELAATVREIRIEWQVGYAQVALAGALRAAGYVAEARSVAYAVQHPGARRKAMSELVEGALRRGESDREALAAALESARLERGAYSSAGALADIAALFLRTGDEAQANALWNECAALIKTMEARNWTWAVRDLSISLARAGLFDEAIEQATIIEDRFQLGVTRERISELLFTAGARVRACELAAAVPEPEQRSLALSALARRLIATGDPEAAIPLLREAEADANMVERGKRQAQPWARLCASWALAGRREDSDRCLAAARRWAEAADARDRDHALGTTARALVEAGRYADARAFLDALAPQTRRYLLRDIAHAMAMHGDVAGAAAALEGSRAVAAAIVDAYSADDVRATLAAAMGRSLRIDAAARLVGQIRDEYRRSSARAKLAAALLAAGRADAALAAAAAVEIESVRDEALSDIAATLAEAGDPGRATAAVRSIADAERRANSAAGVAKTLAAAGDLDGALAFAREHQRAHRFVNPVGAVALALVRAGKEDEGLRIIRGMLRGRKRWWSLREVAEALAARGRAEEGLALAGSIPDEGVRHLGYTSIASTLIAGGRIDAGLAVAEQAPWKDTQRINIVRKAIEALAQSGRHDKALAVALAVPPGLKSTRDEPERDAAVAAVARALAETGHAKEALSVLERIEDPRVRAEVVEALGGRNEDSDEARAKQAEALAAAGRFDAAVEVTLPIRDERDRGYAQLDVVRQLARANRHGEAQKLAGAIHSDAERAKAFYVISTDLVARDRFGEAIAVMADNPGYWEQKGARAEIANALAGKRRFVEAIDAIGLMPIAEFVAQVAGWSGIQAVEPEGFHAALERVLRIAAWANADWSAAADAISEDENPSAEQIRQTARNA